MAERAISVTRFRPTPLAALDFRNPMIAAGAMAITSVSVGGNSPRIRRQKLI